MLETSDVLFIHFMALKLDQLSWGAARDKIMWYHKLGMKPTTSSSADLNHCTTQPKYMLVFLGKVDPPLCVIYSFIHSFNDLISVHYHLASNRKVMLIRKMSCLWDLSHAHKIFLFNFLTYLKRGSAQMTFLEKKKILPRCVGLKIQ